MINRSNRRILLGLPGLLLAIAFLLRLAPIGRYVTPDEPAWVYRSVRFADALAARDWAAIPSTGHPGVTTMWLGALGVGLQRLLAPAEAEAHLAWIRRMAWLAPSNDEAFRHLAFFLPWGRVAVGMATTLGLALFHRLVVRLFDRRVALLATSFLALDSFLTGHSGLLHTDGLLATFCGLSLVCLLIGVRTGGRPWTWSLASGGMAGLALLTKSLGGFLWPFTLIVLAWVWLAGSIRLPRMLLSLALWCLAGAGVYWIGYPAMWSAPLRTVRDLLTAPVYHAQAGLLPTFFAGRMALTHGPEFYLVALPLRLGPLVLVGLVLCGRLFFMVTGTEQGQPRPRRLELAWLGLFALGYVLFLALNVKKYDRYLLPVFFPLALAAAVGWAGVGGGLASRRVGLFSVLLLIQLVLAVVFAPYPLTAFNPLTGGPWAAARLLPVDWGEGMGIAARRLNRLPQADDLTVAVSSVPSFASLFRGRTVPLDQAALADLVVLTAHHPASSLSIQPAGPISLGWVDHGAIYTNTAYVDQVAYLAQRVGEQDLVLFAGDTALSRHYTAPGRLVATLGPDEVLDQAQASEWLRGLGTGFSGVWLVSDPAVSPLVAEFLRREVETMGSLASSDPVGSATLTYYQGPPAGRQGEGPTYARIGDALVLVDAVLPDDPVTAHVPVALRWQTPAPTPTDLHASLYLVDPAGHTWLEVGQVIVDGATVPTSAWDPGAFADGIYDLALPRRIPPDVYTVELVVTDAAGAQLGAWDGAGRFQGVRVGLGKVQVVPPEQPAGPPLCDPGRILDVGPLRVCVPEEEAWAISSGDALGVTLTWSAATAPDADYQLRWRLLDGTGGVSWERVGPLSPYPTGRWRAGDSFAAIYDLRADPDLPAGLYRAAFNVIAPDGGAAWPQDQVAGSVEVSARQRSFDLPAGIDHPLNLRLGDAVRLRGFDLQITEASPGDTIPITLYWQAEGPTDVDYTVFVHLSGEDGRPHGQADFVPAQGAAPTTSWIAGQVIVDHVGLPVAAGAPAGTYHVAVGMYDAASGGRLPVAGPDGGFLADDQAVLPVEITVSGGAP